MADEDYTDIVRSEIDTGADVAYWAMTDDEFEWLISEGADDLTGGIVRMTESLIYRGTGLKVDLSAEGAARTTIVRAGMSENQEHNTFIAVDSGTNTRDLGKITRDTETIPKITPQDANVMVRSIDFPMSRPQGTALDGMRIDEKENPIERAFVSSITTAQVLANWGVDVEELVDAINKYWGIDYAQKLVSSLSLARAKDLVKYLATGGRPDPTIYMSPNVLSKYVVVQSPTVNPMDVGYSQAFIGRAKMLTKFVLTTTNVMRGTGALRELRTHMNPAHMSKFDPSVLVGWDVTIEVQTAGSELHNAVPGLDSFDKFVSARQPLAVALSADRVAIAQVVLAVEKRDRGRLAGYRRVQEFNPRERIFANEEVRQAIVNRVPAEVVTSKVTTILYELLTGSGKAALYGTALATCAEMCMLCAIPTLKLNYARIFGRLENSAGIGQCVQSLNILNAEKIPEVAELFVEYPHLDMRRLTAIYLIRRQVLHCRNQVRNAIKSSALMFSNKVNLAGIQFGNHMKVGSLPRLWKGVREVLCQKTRPFNYLRVHNRAATIASGKNSLMDLDDGVLAYLRSEFPAVRTRSLMAVLRNHWAEYYRTVCKEWQNTLYMCRLMSDDTLQVRKLLPVKENSYEDDSYLAIVASMCYLEAVVAAGSELAYKWAEAECSNKQVPFKIKSPTMQTMAEAYSKYLQALKTKPDLHKDMVVNGHSHRLYGEDQLATAVNGKAKFILRALSDDPGDRELNVTASDIRAAYKIGVDRFKHTLLEAVRNDSKLVNKHIAPSRTSDPQNAAPAESEPVRANDQSALNTTEGLDLAIARIASQYAPTPDDPEMDVYLDVFVPMSYDLADYSEQYAELVGEIAERLTLDFVHRHKELLDSVKEKLEWCTCADNSTIDHWFSQGLGDELVDLGNMLDITIVNNNVMS